jgi:hypothetical protein
VLYYDGRDGEQQCTVITSQRGPLTGKRIVRGRETECLEYYRQPAKHRLATIPDPTEYTSFPIVRKLRQKVSVLKNANTNCAWMDRDHRENTQPPARGTCGTYFAPNSIKNWSDREVYPGPGKTGNLPFRPDKKRN